MMSHSAILISLSIIASLCAGASAQVTPPPKLERVDQTVEDTDSLRITLREMKVELRQPSGFQDVYRVPGDSKSLMRVSGGLYAVFPHSVYGQSQDGQVMAMVPAGTVYHIGLPPPQLTKEPASKLSTPTLDGMTASDKAPSNGQTLFRFKSRIENRVNTLQDDSIDTFSGPAPVDPRSPAADENRSTMNSPTNTDRKGMNEGPSIVMDGNYRAARIADLMRRAAVLAQIERKPAIDSSPVDNDAAIERE